ncbi:protocadherin-like wing polarity protein stan [Cydia splendana]|uniref:protocadherin-like wing polarity protein stan n=1 Tax=Cydia splendana TaxID=1100963 RepID=UPI00212E456D
MRLTTTALFGLLLACFCLSAYAMTCDPSQRKYGCTISVENKCRCYYGCKRELPYDSLTDCNKDLNERGSNACNRRPCRRGICTQTVLAPGFACKCEGTGFYGNYCEKPCPTARLHYGQVFPHECVVI